MILGHIDFLNVLPFTLGIEAGKVSPWQIKKGVPAEVNQALIQKEIQASGISSIVYAQHADALYILPDVSIRTDAAVTSILLLSKVPLEKLQGPVALTAKSATSHALLKIILKEAYGKTPSFGILPLTPENPVPEPFEAALFIGDDALRLYCHPPANLHILDLGAAWKELTGLGMVYSVWAIQQDFVDAHPKETQTLVQALQRALTYGKQHLSEGMQRIAPQKGFTEAELATYFQVIQWDLKPEHLAGLRLFYQKALELGLIANVPCLRFV